MVEELALKGGTYTVKSAGMVVIDAPRRPGYIEPSHTGQSPVRPEPVEGRERKQ